MFCFQCQQTLKGTGCTISGVCGKKADTAAEQDFLTCEMISLAQSMQEKNINCIAAQELIDLIVDGLFTCVTNVNFDSVKIAAVSAEIRKKRVKLGMRNGKSLKTNELFAGDENIISLRSTLLFALRGSAAYAYHARILGKRNCEVDSWFVKGMYALGQEHTLNEWLDLLAEAGRFNLMCMELLDSANTSAYGNPMPQRVSLKIKKGPFIIISGHDLHDLQMLLEQTEGKSVNIYTHGEMLSAHGYPKLNKYNHLKGHFGSAWHNQQNEFKGIRAPILFTTNCIMAPKESYADRVYTTSVVHFPGTFHIKTDSNGSKDFSTLIKHSKELGGYDNDLQLTGLNGGETMLTGFGRKTMLDNAPAIIDAVRTGAVKYFYLVGGCDGAQEARKFYTDFVKNTPKDSIVLTLACGKFRFNDLDIGSIGAFPRIIDMGQCNDAYGAVTLAITLAQELNCGVNELPLTFILSWYEQKAVAILLTLLSLGIKNIKIGPTIPAFFSEKVLNTLIKKYNLQLIG